VKPTPSSPYLSLRDAARLLPMREEDALAFIRAAIGYALVEQREVVRREWIDAELDRRRVYGVPSPTTSATPHDDPVVPIAPRSRRAS